MNIAARAAATTPIPTPTELAALVPFGGSLVWLVLGRNVAEGTVELLPLGLGRLELALATVFIVIVDGPTEDELSELGDSVEVMKRVDTGTEVDSLLKTLETLAVSLF
jgi:hypothetical protein